MKYNFDKLVDRKNTSCAKWDFINARFSRSDLLPFWIADMDFKTAKPITDALLNRVEHGVFGYTVANEDYYKEIINWRKKRFNWDIEKEWVIYTPNVLIALVATIEAFTNVREKVIIQTPVYNSFKEKISKVSREVVTNPLIKKGDKYEIDFDDLEKKCEDPLTKILVLCNPHNPVGRVFNEEELMKIGNICKKNNVLIFSDEIHSDLVFKGKDHIPFAKISDEFANNCVVAISVGKTFNLSGLDMANMIIPNKDIRERIKLQLSPINNFLTVPTLGQVAVIAGYRDGEEWLEQVIEYIEGNIRFIDSYIKENIPSLKLIKSEATYFAWIDCNALGMTDDEISKWLVDELNLAIYQGSIYGEEGRGFIRLNVACSRELLEECLKIIKKGVNELV